MLQLSSPIGSFSFPICFCQIFVSDHLIESALSFKHKPPIAIQFLLLQFIYFWLFYSVGNDTKK